MARDDFDELGLNTTEALDSDEVRNDGGDEVTDPPEQWIAPKEDETLDQRLGDEVPDIRPEVVDPSDADDGEAETELAPSDEIDRLDPGVRGTERGQIDGTPEDGDSFFNVVE